MTGIRDRTFVELDTATLYAVLRLRSEVFGVEQDCVYAEPDGRDNELGTRHVFIDDVAGIDGPAAYLRVLVEPDDQPHVVLLRQRDLGLDVVPGHVVTLGLLGHAGVARGRNQAIQVGRGRQGLHESVFATSGTDHQDVHTHTPANHGP